jgi:hypothetical protein
MAVSALSQSNSIDSAFANIFPLPLTTMESFMVADSHVDYPMMVDLELKLKGSIDRAAFDAGLAFAIARNPLFTCLIEPTKQGTLAWVPTDRMPHVDWAPLGAPFDAGYDRLLDLTQEIGLRIWVRQGQEKSSVLLHYHHACADGMGGIAFVEDLMVGYAAAYSNNTPVSPRTLDPSRLKARGEVGIVGRTLRRRITDSFIGAREGLRFALQKPHPLEPARASTVGSSELPLRPGFITESCSNEVTLGLRRVATSVGATVNDLLLRDLFLTLRRWNAARNPTNDHGNLRIMMPQNLRTREDIKMPAANVMSVAFLTRKAQLCDTPDKLLRSLQEETEAVRRGQLSLYSLGALATLQSAGLQDRLLQRPTCLSTAVLTNIGNPSRRLTARFPRTAEGMTSGNVAYDGIGGVPPVRPLTRAAFTATSSSDSIDICLKCDAKTFTASDTKSLLDEYLAQLRATAEGSSI